jgi:GT2 family glycosyltransferase
MVADNGSTDGSLEMLGEEFPEVKVIALERNYGFAEGYNRTMGQVETEYAVLLNNDVEVTAGWLAGPLSVLEADARVAAVQPKILSERERGRFEYAGAAGGYIDKYGYPFCRGRIMGLTEEDRGQYDTEAEVVWASGACLFVRTSVYKREGGLDGSFFAHQEEIDFCWRLRNRGYRVVCTPCSSVYHVGGGTLQWEHPQKTFLNFRNNLLMLYKNLPEDHLRGVMRVRSVLDAAAGLRYALMGKRENACAVWKAWREYRRVRLSYKEKQEENRKKMIVDEIRGKGSLLYQYYVRRRRSFTALCTKVLGMWLLSMASAWGQGASYEVEGWAGGGIGKVLPFWMVSNRYGVVPLESWNGYVRGKAEYEGRWGKAVHWEVGADMVVAPRGGNGHIQQAYGEIRYKGWELTVGAKERYIPLWDKNLSSGDMIQSGNSRPMPGVTVSVPQFVGLPWMGQWLAWKGEFGVSRAVDEGYLSRSTTSGFYVKDVLRHDKSLFVRLEDRQGKMPLYGTIGLRHTAQWGGESTNPRHGKLPQSFSDFLRVVGAQPGGATALETDRINVLGSHHIGYDVQLGYKGNDWGVELYYQHISADKSGTEMANGMDGLCGISGELPLGWLRKVVVEYVTTRHQSGPFHHIWFDHEKYSARGGGSDNYYNNSVYVNGHAHFGRSEGSPLLPSPEYNDNGRQGFLNTRILDLHAGVEGEAASWLSYRVLCTWMNGWGTHGAPFLRKKTGVSYLVETNYMPPDYPRLTFVTSVGGDTGDVLGSAAYAVSFSLRWRIR